MPIFAPLLSPGEEVDDDGEVAVGVGIELEVEAESVDEISDIDVNDDDDDEVAEARFVCPEARSKAENGNG